MFSLFNQNLLAIDDIDALLCLLNTYSVDGEDAAWLGCRRLLRNLLNASWIKNLVPQVGDIFLSEGLAVSARNGHVAIP